MGNRALIINNNTLGNLHFGQQKVVCGRLKNKKIDDSRHFWDLAEKTKKNHPEEDFVVYLDKGGLPNDIKLYLKTSPETEQAFEQYCDFIAFCSYLKQEQEDGKLKILTGITLCSLSFTQNQGFTDSLFAYKPSQLSSLFTQELAIKLKQTIFINILYGLPTIRGLSNKMLIIHDSLLYRLICHETGHLQQADKIINGLLPKDVFSDAGTEFWALCFERNALIDLHSFLIANSPTGSKDDLTYDQPYLYAPSLFVSAFKQRLIDTKEKTVGKSIYLSAEKAYANYAASSLALLKKNWLPKLIESLQTCFSKMNPAEKEVLNLSQPQIDSLAGTEKIILPG